MAKPDASPRDRIFFFDAAPHACIVLGQDLRVRDVNYAFCLATGWRLDEVLLRSAKDLMGDEAAKRLATLDANWQSVASVAASVHCKDGRTVELEWHVRALPERQKVYCIASSVHVGPPAGRRIAEVQPLPLVETRRGTPAWARRQAPI